MEVAGDALGLLAGDCRGQVLGVQLADALQAAESGEKLASGAGPDAGDFLEF